MIKLNTLFNNIGAKKSKKRVGRGIGSGTGKTCGRGVKGQKARSGVAIKGFEGGQMPLIKRLPKRGFRSRCKKDCIIINLSTIADLMDDNTIVVDQLLDKQFLVDHKLIKDIDLKVKLLNSKTSLSKAVTFKLDYYSESVKNLIENSGSKII